MRFKVTTIVEFEEIFTVDGEDEIDSYRESDSLEYATDFDVDNAKILDRHWKLIK